MTQGKCRNTAAFSVFYAGLFKIHIDALPDAPRRHPFSPRPVSGAHDQRLGIVGVFSESKVPLERLFHVVGKNDARFFCRLPFTLNVENHGRADHFEITDISTDQFYFGQPAADHRLDDSKISEPPLIITVD